MYACMTPVKNHPPCFWPFHIRNHVPTTSILDWYIFILQGCKILPQGCTWLSQSFYSFISKVTTTKWQPTNKVVLKVSLINGMEHWLEQWKEIMEWMSSVCNILYGEKLWRIWRMIKNLRNFSHLVYFILQILCDNQCMHTRSHHNANI